MCWMMCWELGRRKCAGCGRYYSNTLLIRVVGKGSSEFGSGVLCSEISFASTWRESLKKFS
jgi:hypothetical protein